jgi:hypothetical protein
MADMARRTDHLAGATGLAAAEVAVAMIAYLERTGQLGLGQDPTSLVGKVVRLPDAETVCATWAELVRRGQVPDAITEGRRQMALEVYAAYATGKAKPTDPRIVVQSGTGATVRLQSTRGPGTGQTLPGRRQAQARLYQLLPRVTEAVALATGNAPNVRSASSHIAAGLLLGKLRELGWHARLNDAAGHVTVRVQTKHAELIVDPTLRQFFAEGTQIDRTLAERGGFAGTESELAALLAKHAADWISADTETRAVLRETAGRSAANNERDETLRHHVADTMARHFTRHVPQASFGKATRWAQRYAAFVRSTSGAVDRDDALRGFLRLKG